MYKLIIKRLLAQIPVLIGITFLVFFIMSLSPGDPAAIILGDSADPVALEAIRKDLGLNDPLLTRYIRYIVNALKGDFGKSYITDLNIMEQIGKRFPNTMILASASLLVALVIGIPIGIISAKRQYTLVDNVSTVVALLGVSIPNFWHGLIMVIIFSLNLRWLPSSGMGDGFIPLLKSLVLPSVTLGTWATAMIVRMTRSSILEVMRQDYIDTARSKGIKESVITLRHMLKNALIPIITVVGLQFGKLLGGSVLTETVFSWPGIGRFVVDSIKSKDTPAVLGAVIFIAIVFSLVNLAVDILYAFVDPRIKSQYSKG